MGEGFLQQLRTTHRELKREKVPLNPFKLARMLWKALLTEHNSPGRLAWAVGIGVFVGCLPIWGFHLLICIALGFVFKLNKLAAWLSANVSNPFFAPFLVFAEIQVGFLVRDGHFGVLSLADLREMGIRATAEAFLVNCLIGSVVIGLALGVLTGVGTYFGLRWKRRHRPLVEEPDAEGTDAEGAEG